MPDEPLDRFVRRRAKSVATVARSYGDWGTDHAKRVLAWAEHMCRPQNGTSISSILFQWHDASWLQARRDRNIGGTQRPGVRVQPGHVQRRWDEALISAKFHVRI